MSETCPGCGNSYSNTLQNHYTYYPEHKPDEWPECPGCGERYQKIGGHWSKGSCDFPALTDKQMEIATGLLMGDATLLRGDKNATLQLKMINKRYLEHLNQEFGILATRVVHCNTAEEAAKRNRETGFSPNAEAENYSDVYGLHTRNHPGFNAFREWYSSGKKQFPEDVELTPTALKHWYCCDGSMDSSTSFPRISLAISNEIDRRENVANAFKNVGLPEPNFYVNERKDGSMSCMLRFSTPDSETVYNYMGNAVPGFEHKWPK